MIKTIYEQTGWTGAMPQSICQDFDVLASVKETDFDLSDEAFRAYCKRRGVLYKAGSGNRFTCTANHALTKKEFIDQFRYAEEYMGNRYRFDDDEMETHWKIMRAAKGSMQDAWELYTCVR